MLPGVRAIRTQPASRRRNAAGETTIAQTFLNPPLDGRDAS